LIDPQVIETTWKKFQGQAELMFAYYNFESYRRKLGLVKEEEVGMFYEPPTGVEEKGEVSTQSKEQTETTTQGTCNCKKKKQQK